MIASLVEWMFGGWLQDDEPIVIEWADVMQDLQYGR